MTALFQVGLKSRLYGCHAGRAEEMAKVLTENKREKIPAVRGIYTAICLFFVLSGAFLWGKKLLAAEVTPMVLVLTAGGLSLCLEILYLGKKQKIFLSLVFFLLFGFVVIREGFALAEGVKELANRFLELINLYQRTDFLLWYVEGKSSGAEQAFLLLCIFLGFLEVLLVSCAGKKWSRNLSVLCLPVLTGAVGFLAGKSPSQEGMVLILAGFLALQPEPGKKGTMPMVAGMGVLIGIAAAFSVSGKGDQILARYHKSWLERQLRLENQMLERVRQLGAGQLFFRNQEQPEYTLDNEEPRQTGAEIFQITVDRVPEQPVYIRGFIGGDYSGKSWEKVSRQEFSDWAGSFGKPVQDCQEAVQNFSCEQLKKMSEETGLKSQNVTIKLKEPAESYTLIPYYTRISGERYVEGDGSLAPRKQKELQWESFLTLTSWQRDGAAAFQEKNPSGEIWEQYQSYVQKTYTRLPEQGLKRLRALADGFDRESFRVLYPESDDYGASLSQEDFSGGLMRAAWQVQNRMWKDTYYSWDLEPVPEGKDFAEYFLLEQKKGYCVHYATAGTLLLRMCGIPARYVSGYIVFPEDFQKNKDGTWTARVTDRRGHAWTEIFQKGLGFLPVEMTPPAYTDLLAEVRSEEDMKETLQQLDRQEESVKKQEEERKKEMDIPKEQPAKNQQQEEPQNQRQNPKPEDTAKNTKIPEKSGLTDAEKGRTAMAASASLAGGGTLFFLLWCLKKSRRRKRQAAFFQEDRAQGALAMGKAMKPMLKSLGLEQKRPGDLEYAAFLEEKLPGMGWRRGMFLLQKSAFSRQGITEVEFQEVEKLYGNLVQKVLEEKGRLWKWFLT